MSGIFSVLTDSQNGLQRFKQAAKGAAGPTSLADKARAASATFSLDQQWLKGARTAAAAMQEALRVGNPKAMGEQRLEEVERRIRELRSEARLAAARGDRDKLAQLAREAAGLARKAGKAAKEYSLGISAAAEMGLGGGAGLGTVSTTVTQSTTTLTLQQVDVSIDIRISGDAAARLAGEAIPAAALPAAEMTAVADGVALPEAAAAEAASVAAGDPSSTDPASAASPSVSGEPRPEGSRYSMQGQIADNALKRSRWKEADAFGRRVEAVLAQVKAIINDAKRASEMDLNHERRARRRKEFEEDDKEVSAAQQQVNDLRSAAFGSATGSGDLLSSIAAALAPPADESADSAAAVPALPAVAPAAGLDVRL